MKLYISNQTNPYLNVSFEKSLLDKKEESIFLWINDPCVVIGRNQNPYVEVDQNYLNQNNIKLVRRYSGGGAVYHDLGNVNYTYITRDSNPEKIIQILKNVLSCFNINITQTGRNDLTVDEKKISGMAFYLEDEWTMYHGTCMIDLNIEKLTKSLTPSKTKLESKGINSVKSRVINLIEKDKNLSTKKLIDTFKIIAKIKEEPFIITKEIIEQAEKLSSYEWLFGECPRFKCTFEKKIGNSIYQIYLSVKNNIIQEIDVYTDSINPKFDKNIFSVFVGQIYNEQSINHFIEKIL